MSGTSLDEGPHDKEFIEVWGCNMAVSRDALERVGPFREGLRIQQEWEWQRRLLAAGGRTFYVADAWLHHRRLADDMRPIRLMRDSFTRGWRLGRHRGTVQPPDLTLAEVRAPGQPGSPFARPRAAGGLRPRASRTSRRRPARWPARCAGLLGRRLG